MSLRHPLARVKGAGPSGEGSHHWWLQRLSALALIPLGLWFMFAVIGHLDDDYSAVVQWLSHPGVALAAVLFSVFMFFHAHLGVQVVIEDYIHNEAVKMISLLISKAVLLVAGAASVFAILSLAL